ncbi:dUTPase-like protein [Obelidium mucronatum]|nr:dUTPase-like protein [Obelidium mucronatum]
MLEKLEQMLSANTPTLQVKLLSDKARLPVRGSIGAAGYDLCSAKDMVIPAGQRAIVPTDISIAVPAGTYGRVAPRSGLAVKHFIDVGAGVIDADYRGPVGVVLFNFGSLDFEIKEGDRVAQLILEQCCIAEIDNVEQLDDTVRGAGGFGSTGVRKNEEVSEEAIKKMKTVSV